MAKDYHDHIVKLVIQGELTRSLKDGASWPAIPSTSGQQTPSISGHFSVNKYMLYYLDTESSKCGERWPDK